MLSEEEFYKLVDTNIISDVEIEEKISNWKYFNTIQQMIGEFYRNHSFYEEVPAISDFVHTNPSIEEFSIFLETTTFSLQDDDQIIM